MYGRLIIRTPVYKLNALFVKGHSIRIAFEKILMDLRGNGTQDVSHVPDNRIVTQYRPFRLQHVIPANHYDDGDGKHIGQEVRVVDPSNDNKRPDQPA